ncbi:hypothetical protein BDV96DRAFT_157144 [Lophiotrema nucula]|uniref:Uncharacterized protein n=1 Tax=Lophiotrema nucula TaxID=690887 RepID=A0A6A5Z1N7_9PLEO|nr:hypothetical protein BDV96DRAFT_157144 [Lophiotrema nucula]
MTFGRTASVDLVSHSGTTGSCAGKGGGRGRKRRTGTVYYRGSYESNEGLINDTYIACRNVKLTHMLFACEYHIRRPVQARTSVRPPASGCCSVATRGLSRPNLPIYQHFSSFGSRLRPTESRDARTRRTVEELGIQSANVARRRSPNMPKSGVKDVRLRDAENERGSVEPGERLGHLWDWRHRTSA